MNWPCFAEYTSPFLFNPSMAPVKVFFDIRPSIMIISFVTTSYSLLRLRTTPWTRFIFFIVVIFISFSHVRYSAMSCSLDSFLG